MIKLIAANNQKNQIFNQHKNQFILQVMTMLSYAIDVSFVRLKFQEIFVDEINVALMIKLLERPQIKVLVDVKEQPSISDSMKLLNQAVSTGEIKIALVDPKTKEEINFVAIQIVKGILPGNNEDFKMVMENHRLVIGSRTLEVESKSLHECYQKCSTSKTFSCSSFSFCESNSNCRLGTSFYSDESLTLQNETETSTSCKVFRKNGLKFFDSYPGKNIISDGNSFVNDISSADECAVKCQDSEACRGFLFCQDDYKACIHHKVHLKDMTDLKEGIPECTYYSRKRSTEYALTPNKVLLSKKSKSEYGLTLEQCAKNCSESKNCGSFNYCPLMEDLQNSRCDVNVIEYGQKAFLSSQTCAYYQSFDESFRKQQIVGKLSSEGKLTSNTFTGVSIGLLLIGLMLGSIGFWLFDFYRPKKNSLSDATITIQLVEK